MTDEELVAMRERNGELSDYLDEALKVGGVSWHLFDAAKEACEDVKRLLAEVDRLNDLLLAIHPIVQAVADEQSLYHNVWGDFCSFDGCDYEYAKNAVHSPNCPVTIARALPMREQES